MPLIVAVIVALLLAGSAAAQPVPPVSAEDQALGRELFECVRAKVGVRAELIRLQEKVSLPPEGDKK